MGTPFAVPTSRGFRVLAALSGVFVIVLLFVRAADLQWAIIVCAAGAAISYSLGSVLHYPGHTHTAQLDPVIHPMHCGRRSAPCSTPVRPWRCPSSRTPSA